MSSMPRRALILAAPEGRATVTRLADGEDQGAESSLNKIWWSELDVELHRVALDLLGPDAEGACKWLCGLRHHGSIEEDGPWNEFGSSSLMTMQLSVWPWRDGWPACWA
jgi:hypothetical protein